VRHLVACLVVAAALAGQASSARAASGFVACASIGDRHQFCPADAQGRATPGHDTGKHFRFRRNA
jgi:hypothetical protein